MSGPLTGVRVLDLSRVLAGPWASQIFADYGADVVKVERRGAGDDTRRFGPPWIRDPGTGENIDAAYYASCNRGKRSLTLDISNVEGHAIARRNKRSAAPCGSASRCRKQRSRFGTASTHWRTGRCSKT